MNQIPNIEETHTHWKHNLNQLLKAVSRDEVGSFKDVEDWHHHQLQKARHDWLREEIVKLEEVKVTKDQIDQAKYSNGNPVQRLEIKQLIEWVNHRTI